MEDFGVKYWSKEDKDHLCNSLGKILKYTTDYEGKNYCRLTLNWNYKLGYVDISMPGYVPRALERLQHKPKNSRSTHHTHLYVFNMEKRRTKVHHNTGLIIAVTRDRNKKHTENYRQLLV